jgi:predicted permease
MEALINVALPVFGIVLAGYLAGRFAILGEHSSEALNRFVYWVALPALLFSATARAPAREVLNASFLVAFVGGSAATFLVAYAVCARFFPNRLAGRTLHALSASVANTGYMGIPLFIAAFGLDRSAPAISSSIFNGAIAVGVAITLIEIDLSPATRWWEIACDVSSALVRNPLVTFPLAGLALSFLGLRLPTPIDNFCSFVGAAAGPCALFALGLFLVGKPLEHDVAEIGWLCVAKLILQPALTWAIAVPFLGMEPFWAGSAVPLAALPTGALAFTVAQNYDIYVRRASTATLLTTVLSVITVSAVLAFFDLR